MANITYEIVKHLGIIAEGKWDKELNIVSWNGKEPKFDIREWSENHEKCSKGATFTEQEIRNLKELLNSLDI